MPVRVGAGDGAPAPSEAGWSGVVTEVADDDEQCQRAQCECSRVAGEGFGVGEGRGRASGGERLRGAPAAQPAYHNLALNSRIAQACLNVSKLRTQVEGVT